jgi:dUTP pyrophosphatase
MLIKNKKKDMVKIYAHKEHPKAIIPKVAYDDTSACFDITCIEDTVIPAGKFAIVPNGLNLVIEEHEPYWMLITLRSSLGFKKDLVPHYGVVDAGYTGNFSVKIYNLGDEDITIKEGDRYAQIAVMSKPKYTIEEINHNEFLTLQNNQSRGNKGFGSSGK